MITDVQLNPDGETVQMFMNSHDHTGIAAYNRQHLWDMLFGHIDERAGAPVAIISWTGQTPVWITPKFWVEHVTTKLAGWPIKVIPAEVGETFEIPQGEDSLCRATGRIIQVFRDEPLRLQVMCEITVFPIILTEQVQA